MGKSKKKSTSTLLHQQPPSNSKPSNSPSVRASPPAAHSAKEPQITEPMAQAQAQAQAQIQTQSQPQQDFPSFYLSSVTAAFADDIEKLRLASDFKDSSLPILIQALKEGAEIYGGEERERWIGR